MQYQELQKYQLVQSFLNLIRNTQSKQEFLNKVQEFDSRFTQDQNTHTFSEKHKSVEKLPPIPPEKPKNPFKINHDDNLRYHPTFNNNQTAQNFNQINQTLPTNIPRGLYSRTQQNFYKMPTNSILKTQNLNQGNQNYNYGGLNNQNNRGNQPQNNNYGGSGVGMINYNAFSQKQYNDLKQQFFRPPTYLPNDHYSKIQQNYNMRNIENSFNMNPLGTNLAMSSSTQLLGGLELGGKASGRGYQERSNPFQRQ